MAKTKTQTPAKTAQAGTFTITCEDKTCVVSKPTKTTLSKAFRKLVPFMGQEPDIIAAGEIVLRDGFLSGDKDFLTVDEYTIAAAIKCAELVEVKDAEIKKN